MRGGYNVRSIEIAHIAKFWVPGRAAPMRTDIGLAPCGHILEALSVLDLLLVKFAGLPASFPVRDNEMMK